MIQVLRICYMLSVNAVETSPVACLIADKTETSGEISWKASRRSLLACIPDASKPPPPAGQAEPWALFFNASSLTTANHHQT